MAASIAEEIMDKFKEDWEEAMENLDTADAAFDNLEVRIRCLLSRALPDLPLSPAFSPRCAPMPCPPPPPPHTHTPPPYPATSSILSLPTSNAQYLYCIIAAVIWGKALIARPPCCRTSWTAPRALICHAASGR